MNLLLQTSNNDLQAQIAVTGSKSETNRLLLLQALFPTISLANTSNSDDRSNADGFEWGRRSN
jgi:3-phosphoshikimate 1-carboxyvinyltransferase